jgi:hypothetical protein
LKERNIDILEQRVLAMSTPSSPGYGSQMKLGDINALTHPGEEAVKAVTDFLRGFHVEGIEYSSGFIRFHASVAEAEKILSAEYKSFQHSRTGLSTFRCDSYSLPEEIAELVSFAAPTVNFPVLDRAPAVKESPLGYTPNCVAKFTDTLLTTKSKATIAATSDNNLDTYVTLSADGIDYWKVMLSTSDVKLALVANTGNENVTFNQGLTVRMMVMGPSFYQIFLDGTIFERGTFYNFVGSQIGSVDCSPEDDDIVVPHGVCVEVIDSVPLTPNTVATIDATSDVNWSTYVQIVSNGVALWTVLISSSSAFLSSSVDIRSDVVVLTKGLNLTMRPVGQYYQIFLSGNIVDNGTEYNVVGKLIGNVQCNTSSTVATSTTGSFHSTPDSLRALYGVNDGTLKTDRLFWASWDNISSTAICKSSFSLIIQLFREHRSTKLLVPTVLLLVLRRP